MSSSNDAVINEAFKTAQYDAIKDSLEKKRYANYLMEIKDGILLPENAARLTLEGYDVVVVINGTSEKCYFVILWFLAEKGRIGKCVVHAFESFIKEEYEKKVVQIVDNSLTTDGDLPSGFIE